MNCLYRLVLHLPSILLALLNLSVAQEAGRSSGWVVIPVNEYGALRARISPVEREPEPPPLEATLTRVDYDLQANGELATGRASVTVDVIKDGWVCVPIPAGLLVRRATLEGKLLSLVASPAAKEGGGQLMAVLSKRGRSVLLLDIAVPVVSAAGDQKLSLPASAAGVTRASVAVPRQDMDVKIAGGLLAEKSDGAAQTRWLAYGRGNEPLVFTWRRKLEERRVAQPLRLRGSLTELLGLGEDSTSVYAEASVEVTQGALRQARILLPASVTVNQVMGAMIADWEMKAGELLVSFLEPVEQSARFVIAGESHLPREGSIDVPLMRLLDTERDGGGVAVEVLGAGEIKEIKSQGLDKVDAGDLGQLVSSRQSPSLVAFRFRPGAAGVARALTVQIARYAQQAVLTANVEEARYRVLMSQEGKTLVEARYAVRNNQRNFLRVVLPAGATVWSASLAGNPVRPGQASDGSLLLPLMKARAGEEVPAFPVAVLYLVRGAVWSEKGRAALALPALDLPVSRTGLQLYYPPLFKAAAEPGSFRLQAFEPPSSAALNAERMPSSAEEPRSASPQAAQADLLQQLNLNVPQPATQALVDQYRARSAARKAAGSIPIRVEFPALGPSLFLVSELTAENKGPSVEISYQREKKRGGE